MSDDDEFLRIRPAMQAGVQLALGELHADLGDVDELFYDVHVDSCMVDVYVKLTDGRTAIGTAFAPPNAAKPPSGGVPHPGDARAATVPRTFSLASTIGGTGTPC